MVPALAAPIEGRCRSFRAGHKVQTGGYGPGIRGDPFICSEYVNRFSAGARRRCAFHLGSCPAGGCRSVAGTAACRVVSRSGHDRVGKRLARPRSASRPCRVVGPGHAPGRPAPAPGCRPFASPCRRNAASRPQSSCTHCRYGLRKDRRCRFDRRWCAPAPHRRTTLPGRRRSLQSVSYTHLTLPTN